MRRLLVLLPLLLPVTAAVPAGADAPPGRRTTTTQVGGSWTLRGDLSGDVRGVVAWRGDLSGGSVLEGTSTTDAQGTVRGRYREVVDVVGPDGRVGTVTLDVRFVLDRAFSARARIVDGTCGFARSGGTLELTGSPGGGTWVGRWVHPIGPPETDVCVPDRPGRVQGWSQP